MTIRFRRWAGLTLCLGALFGPARARAQLRAPDVEMGSGEDEVWSPTRETHDTARTPVDVVTVPDGPVHTLPGRTVQVDLPAGRRVTAVVEPRIINDLLLTFEVVEALKLFIGLPLTFTPGDGPEALDDVPGYLPRVRVNDLRMGTKLKVLRQKQHGVDFTLVLQLNVPSGVGLDLTAPFSGLHDQAWWGELVTGEPLVGLVGVQTELQLSRDLTKFTSINARLGFRARHPTRVGAGNFTEDVYARVGVSFKGKKLKEKVKLFRYVPLELRLDGAGANSTRAKDIRLPTLQQLRDGPEAPTLQPSGEVILTTGLEYPWLHPYAQYSLGMAPGQNGPDLRVMVGMKVTTELIAKLPW
ncbi:MAG: hypothetical protein AB2A00_04580 [Myxococcota bacterium]